MKYNDPIYVKMEKLDIMIRLTNQSNIGQTLAELKEYVLMCYFGINDMIGLFFHLLLGKLNEFFAVYLSL